jgi:hypothetical protein
MWKELIGGHSSQFINRVAAHGHDRLVRSNATAGVVSRKHREALPYQRTHDGVSERRRP